MCYAVSAVSRVALEASRSGVGRSCMSRLRPCVSCVACLSILHAVAFSDLGHSVVAVFFSASSLLFPCFSTVGRVRTKTVKKSATQIIESYYQKLTADFQVNKRVVDEIATIQSKRMRNKIAGYVTHLMVRIQRGPVRGISLKLQEEERERRMDYVPEKSQVDTLIENKVKIDTLTMKMLSEMDFANIKDVIVRSGEGQRRQVPRGPRRQERKAE